MYTYIQYNYIIIYLIVYIHMNNCILYIYVRILYDHICVHSHDQSMLWMPGPQLKLRKNHRKLCSDSIPSSQNREYGDP